MKEVFFEYDIKKLKKIKKEVLDDSIFILDANALLDLYRVTENTRNQLFKILEQLSSENRLVLPYQVGKEFYNNRINVINDKINEIQELQKNFKNALSILKKKNFYSNDKKLIEEISKKTNEITKKIESSGKVNENMVFNQDEILEKILKIFDKKVEKKFSIEEIEKIENEGEERYKKKIPPGYEDEYKEKNKYGDLIVWKEILAISKKYKKNIAFVSRDEKEDWEIEFRGKMVSPRKELLEEMQECTKKYFWKYTLSEVIDIMKDKIKIENVKGVIDEVQHLEEQSKKVKIEKLKMTYEEICELVERGKYIMQTAIFPQVKDYMINEFRAKGMQVLNEGRERLKKFKNDSDSMILLYVGKIENELLELDKVMSELMYEFSDC